MIERFPFWLKKRIVINEKVERTSEILKDLSLHTVCEEAGCPNINECFSQSTATFMILGNLCTRNCHFCGVKKASPSPLPLPSREGKRRAPSSPPVKGGENSSKLSPPLEGGEKRGGGLPVDNAEPARVAEAAERLGLRYVVITSVTRDDLGDGGAEQFRATILAIREKIADSKVEVLTPDFQGCQESLKTVLSAKPDVFNHNLETIERLYLEVRPQANYRRSLKVLKFAKEAGFITKSGMMLGLGEKKKEVIKAMQDLREVGCSLLTIGQYLQPNKESLKVERFIPPEEFSEYEEIGEKLGFTSVVSGPFVRSSYHAKNMLECKND